MASVLLGYVGGYAFGEWGMLIGSLAGYAVDSQFLYSSGDENLKGPRMEELRVSSSAYGRPIEKVYGTARVAGNIIWATDIVEEENTEEVGGGGCGGGTEYTTYSYYGNFAVGICAGPVQMITKVWANKKLIWDATDWENNDIGSEYAFLLHMGTEVQLPDAGIISFEGINVPAFRGLCYITFIHYPLEQYGNQLPSMEFEVTTSFDPEAPYVDVDGTGAQVFSSDRFKFNQNHSFAVYIADHHFWRINTTTKAVEAHVDGELLALEVPGYLGNLDIDERGYIYTTQDSPFANSVYFAKLDGEDFDVIFTSSMSAAMVDEQAKDVWAIDEVAVSRNPEYPVAWYAEMGPGTNGNVHVTHRDTFCSPTLGQMAICDSFAQPGTQMIPQMMAVDHSDGSCWVIYRDFYGSLGQTCLRKYYPLRGIGQTGYADGWGVSDHDISGDVYLGDRICFDPITNQVIVGSTSGMDSLGDYAGLAFYDASDGTLNGRLLDDICGAYSKSAFSEGVQNGYLWVQYAGGANGYKKVNVSSMTLEQEYDMPGSDTAAMGVYNAYQHATYFVMTAGAPAGVRVVWWDRGLPINVELDDIVTDLCAQAGIDSDDIDVTDLTDAVWGYKLNQRMSVRAALQPLMNAYFFDAVESDAKLKFPKRGQASIATITEDDLACHLTENQRAVTMDITKQQEAELPKIVEITYQDYVREYDVGVQRAMRQICNTEETIAVNLAINLGASEAKQIAEKTLWFLWLSKNRHKFYLPPKYIYLDPCDVVTITEGGNTHVLRIEKMINQGGVIEVDALPEDSSVYSSTATGTTGEVYDPYIANPGYLTYQVLDIPMLRELDNQAGFYLAAQGFTEAWRGGQIYTSLDGISWAEFGAVLNSSIMGRAESALGDTPDPTIIDNGNTVDVLLTDYDDTLASITEAALLNEGNPCLLGDEIICFQTVTDNGNGSYTLAGLLRGRRGTEWATGTHYAGERFILLESGKLAFEPVPLSYENTLRYFWGVSFGTRFSTGVMRSFTPQLATLMPLSPVHIKGTRDGSENIALTWIRRTRIGGAWQDEHDVPLGENTEAYEIAVFDDAGDEIITVSSTTAAGTVTGSAISAEAPWLIMGDNTETGDTTKNIPQANYKTVSLFTLARDLTAITGIMFHAEAAHAEANVKGIIYTSNAGEPDALQATTDELAGVAAGWNLVEFASPITLTAGDWFIGVIGDHLVTSDLGLADTGTNRYNSDTYSDGPADPFGTPTSSTTQLPIYLVGNYPPELNIAVYQISDSVGRGFAGEATI